MGKRYVHGGLYRPWLAEHKGSSLPPRQGGRQGSLSVSETPRRWGAACTGALEPEEWVPPLSVAFGNKESSQDWLHDFQDPVQNEVVDSHAQVLRISRW